MLPSHTNALRRRPLPLLQETLLGSKLHLHNETQSCMATAAYTSVCKTIISYRQETVQHASFRPWGNLDYYPVPVSVESVDLDLDLDPNMDADPDSNLDLDVNSYY